MSCHHLLVVLSVSQLLAAGQLVSGKEDTYSQVERDKEYKQLSQTVEDKVGLDAIRALHQQLDDDNDGTIEPSETGDFIKADLRYDEDGKAREKLFHKKDSEITVPDLWSTWAKSDVHNWTVDQTVEWLVQNVDLPQYKETFERGLVDGKKLPRAASDPSFLSKVLGITNSIHRSKISLKAMDIVLFGPPKEPSNWLKDVILTSLLLALLTALFWAYKTKKSSEAHLTKMMKDMESLSRAEKVLQDMQTKLVQEKVVVQEKVQVLEEEGGEEVGRLREEVEILRGELHRAEIELEDRCWVAPTVLQHWLQLTYELESKVYNVKRQSAETQMEQAKDACEKLKRKRSSLVGAFVSTHGRSIDDVDKSILEAKTALMELTQDLTERSQRWRQVEMLTGVSIVNNPGIQTLQRLVRHVGGGNRALGGRSTVMSSRMSNMNDDELETRSLAPSVAASHVSSHVSGSVTSRVLRTTNNTNSRDLSVSRESSKESSNSESEISPPTTHGRERSRVSQTSMASSIESNRQMETQSLAGDQSTYSPSLRRMRMIKSLSQDAGGGHDMVTNSLSTSHSDSALHSQATGSLSLLTVGRARQKGSPPGSTLSEVEESSDTGSINDLDGKKKKKSFFNFRKKKEKTSS